MTVISPLPGFDWNLVQWGAPDQTRTEHCSYCGEQLSETEDDNYQVPLILWNEAGRCAEFCIACQVKWWGFQPSEDPPELDNS